MEIGGSVQTNFRVKLISMGSFLGAVEICDLHTFIEIEERSDDVLMIGISYFQDSALNIFIIDFFSVHTVFEVLIERLDDL